MNLTQLEYFYCVAQAKSFVGGARRACVSQPAISKAIKRLEAHVGAELFVRSTRSVSLTEAGELLLERCSGLFEEIEAIQRDIDDLRGTIRGELRLAAMEVFSIAVLPKALADFSRRYPEVRLRIYEMVPELMERALLEGLIDVGYTIGGGTSRHVAYGTLGQSAGCLVCGPSHPLFERGTVKAADISSYPSVAPSFFELEHLPPLDQFPESKYPRNVTATIELLQMGVRLCTDGDFLGFFPEISIREWVTRGELKVLTGIDFEPFELKVLTRKGVRPKRAVQLLTESVRALL